MTDIVERLRDRDGRWMSRYCKPQRVEELRNEAADEIERLRAALREIKSKCGDPRIVSDIARRALEPKP